MHIFLNSPAHFFVVARDDGAGSGNFGICAAAPEC